MDLVIRPSFHTYRNRFFLAAFVCGLVAVVDVLGLRRKPVQQEVEAITFALMAIVIGLVVLLAFRREEVKVANGTLTRWNLLGLPTRYPLDGIGGMTRRDVTYVGLREPAHLVVVYDKQRRCLFKMNRVIWDPTDIRRLHARLGGDGTTQLITSGELASEFPGSAPWLIEHPFVTIGLEFLVLLGLLVGLVALQDALNHR